MYYVEYVSIQAKIYVYLRHRIGNISNSYYGIGVRIIDYMYRDVLYIYFGGPIIGVNAANACLARRLAKALLVSEREEAGGSITHAFGDLGHLPAVMATG